MTATENTQDALAQAYESIHSDNGIRTTLKDWVCGTLPNLDRDGRIERSKVEGFAILALNDDGYGSVADLVGDYEASRFVSLGLARDAR